jgi:hypothetical protein
MNAILNKRICCFFTLLGLIFSFNNCSPGDDELSYHTFLEKYGGTKWFITNDENIYIRLNDDLNKLIEEWEYYETDDCYEYQDKFFGNGTYEIIKNSSEKLVIQYSAYNIFSETLTFSIEEEFLKVFVQYSSGVNPEPDTYYFERTSENVDHFKKCIN